MTPDDGPGATPETAGLDQLRAALAGRYDIGQPIGRGGMATVYRVLDLRHQRPVALKVLHPELAVALGAERFLREIQIEARLNHPHILTLLDSGQSAHFLYFLTPWADGGTLRERLNREAQLSLEDSLQIVDEVGDALAHAHRNGIIHRDVKPENILFSSGHALLADFGIAHAVADTGMDALTDSGLAVGTPTYMSPEQAMPGGVVDERSDQYALACILFEMLAGEPPFTGRTTRTVLARHITERPPSLTVVRPDLPPFVVAAINRALEKTPAARFPSVDRFRAALREQATTPMHVAAIPTTRNRWAVAGALAVTVGLTAILWPRDDTALSPDKIVVFPLATRGLPAVASGLGLGVAYLLEAALERADPLQLIDGSGRLTPGQLADPLTISDRDARGIARQLGAAYSLRGVVQGHTDSSTVILRLYGVAGDSLVSQSSASGSSTATPLHHLGLDALKALLPALIDPSPQIDFAALRNRRAQSIALWMQGERHYRRSQFDSASRFYERALEEDSAFALAAVKGAQAAHWIHDETRAVQLVARALSLGEQLPRKYEWLARGLSAQFAGDPDAALTALLEARRADPEWAEADAALGEVYVHLLPSVRRVDSLGRRLDSLTAPLDSLARITLSAAIARDSGFTAPLYHLAEDAIREGRIREADILIDRFHRAGAEPRLRRTLQLMRDCVAGSPEPWRVDAPPDAVGLLEAAKSLSPGGKQAGCAEAGFRAVLRSSYSTDAERWGAWLGLQGTLIARARWQEARALIDSIVAAGKGAVRSAYVLGHLAGAPMEDQSRALEQFAAGQFGPGYGRLPNVEPLWVLLVWHAARGDSAMVELLADTLAARAGRSRDQRAVMYAGAARAHVDLIRRDTAAAIDRLYRIGPPGSGGDTGWRYGDALPVERLLLARLLLGQGRYRESLRAASVFDHYEPIMFLWFTSESLALRYRAALALGDRGAADSFRRRLERLGRQDLVGAANQNRR